MTTYLKSNSIIACIKLDANFKDENKNSSTSRISVREKQKTKKTTWLQSTNHHSTENIY